MIQQLKAKLEELEREYINLNEMDVAYGINKAVNILMPVIENLRFQRNKYLAAFLHDMGNDQPVWDKRTEELDQEILKLLEGEE